MKKETKIQLLITFILAIILGIFIIITVNKINENHPIRGRNKGMIENDFKKPEEENEEKETTANDIEEGEIVSQKEINLNEYETNITIKDAGEYTLKGDFKHSIIINSNSNVTLVLNNVNIQNNETAAIANIGENKLIIKLPENSENNLSDGGSSEYDSCIYSIGELVIEGNGTLNVQGKQSEGEGIATETNNITINGGIINIESNDDGINAGGDGGLITINAGEIYIKASGDGIDSNKNLIINGGNIYTIGSTNGGNAAIDTDMGYEINGGEVIALGSDMMEKPENSSKQKSISFNINTNITSRNRN